VTTSVDSWCYVFGIVPAGAELSASEGSGPAAQLRLVEADGIAAVVGTPPDDRALGRAADLLEHDRVLADILSSGTPVLPMRFGAVMSDETAVAQELLRAHRDDLLAELESLRDRVQYTVKVRYEQDAVLRQVVAGHPEIERLRSSADNDGTDAFDRQLRLGELVVKALEQLRPADAAAVMEDIGTTADSRVHDASSPEDVLNAAFLVDRARADDFERRVEKLAERHSGRLRVRLVGPAPAYDFVRSA
jgi:nucleotide-binding universal stress UspA family protein